MCKEFSSLISHRHLDISVSIPNNNGGKVDTYVAYLARIAEDSCAGKGPSSDAARTPHSIHLVSFDLSLAQMHASEIGI